MHSSNVFLSHTYLLCVKEYDSDWVQKIFELLYSFQLLRMSSSLVSMTQFCCLMDLGVWDLLPRRCQMLWQSALLGCQW